MHKTGSQYRCLRQEGAKPVRDKGRHMLIRYLLDTRAVCSVFCCGSDARAVESVGEGEGLDAEGAEIPRGGWLGQESKLLSPGSAQPGHRLGE